MNAEANLRALLQERVMHDEQARRALELFARSPQRADEALSLILRDHRVAPITLRSEIESRDGLDRVLLAYALIEIGCFARSMPEPLPASFVHTARGVLHRTPILTYYEVHYPLPLVSDLRTRIEAGHGARIPEHHERAAGLLYRAFTELDRTVSGDEDVQVFLRMLDDYRWEDRERAGGSVGFEHLLDKLEEPDAFGRAIASDSTMHPVIAMGARGTMEFLEFALRLDALLFRAARIAGLSERFWGYYAYWFERMQDSMRVKLDQVISCFEHWAIDPFPPDEIDVHDVPDAPSADTSQIRKTLDRLFEGPVAYRGLATAAV